MLNERKGAGDEVEQWPLLEEDALGPRWHSMLCVISTIDVVLNCLLCPQYCYVVHDILIFRLM